MLRCELTLPENEVVNIHHLKSQLMSNMTYVHGINFHAIPQLLSRNILDFPVIDNCTSHLKGLIDIDKESIFSFIGHGNERLIGRYKLTWKDSNEVPLNSSINIILSIPSIARIVQIHESKEQMSTFAKAVLDERLFSFNNHSRIILESFVD